MLLAPLSCLFAPLPICSAAGHRVQHSKRRCVLWPTLRNVWSPSRALRRHALPPPALAPSHAPARLRCAVHCAWAPGWICSWFQCRSSSSAAAQRLFRGSRLLFSSRNPEAGSAHHVAEWFPPASSGLAADRFNSRPPASLVYQQPFVHSASPSATASEPTASEPNQSRSFVVGRLCRGSGSNRTREDGPPCHFATAQGLSCHVAFFSNCCANAFLDASPSRRLFHERSRR